ncbi:MAG: 50S ribosomal protein L24 [Candidatus Omnitrophota bacterium]|jgi:large subunit ribosomal protein L24|nr:50S ribosomal protein L24 [Candidatus Omnitrophota bacterium]|tara:strand:+ start:220 stop:531 length:312 start_codon:yes stop_codon:yes gene_type:complete
MSKIKKNDTVKILTGKDSGKTGKVLTVLPDTERVLVQGLNLAKKHARKTKEDQQGGIIQKENTIHVSNVMVVCQKCGKQTSIGSNRLSDGTKVRICKKCKELL